MILRMVWGVKVMLMRGVIAWVGLLGKSLTLEGKGGYTVLPTFNCLLYTPIVCLIELSALILPSEMSALID